jgi:predicted nucleotide-binding protein
MRCDLSIKEIAFATSVLTPPDGLLAQCTEQLVTFQRARDYAGYEAVESSGTASVPGATG